MNSVKLLENFEPFKDLWYDKCYYHALFPVISHFNKDISSFLSNNIFAYSLKQQKDVLILELKNLSRKTSDDLLQDIGISLKKSISDQIVADVISSINHNNPVILGIDCFYESIRFDTYKKNHWPHDLLIYGYDLTNKNFAIIEHDFRDSFEFKKKTITFKDIESSYYGYLQNISNNHATYYEYSLNPQSPQISPNDYKQIYVENLRKYKDEIYLNIDKILMFKKELYTTTGSTNLASYFPLLLSSMNNIVNMKKIQKYSLLHIFDLPDTIIKNLNETISVWSTIRGIIGKYVFMSKFNITSIEKAAAKLDSIYKAEQSFLLFLYDYIG